MYYTPVVNRQVDFWKSPLDYMEKNDGFDQEVCRRAWQEILIGVDKAKVSSVLECGSNIGRNLNALQVEFPKARLMACDVNKEALEVLSARIPAATTINSSILEIPNSYSADLVFTSGVLIHIHPDDLVGNLQKIYNLSKSYIVIAEYFSQKLEMVHYKDRDNLLWKMDFGAKILDNFSVLPIRQGFLWSGVYGTGGFDDLVYWVFKKL